MKAIILGITSAVVAVVGMAAPAGAFGGVSYGGNSSWTKDGYVRMGVSITDAGVKAYFVGEQVMCHKSNSARSGGFTFGNTTPVEVEPTKVPSATQDTPCNPQQVVNNPEPGTTVTINGVCGDPAELAKITKANSSIIINSTGPCPTDADKPASGNGPAPEATVIVKEIPVVTAAAASETPAANPQAGDVAPAELPQTGMGNAMLAAVAAVLGGATYGGALLVRSFRR